MAGVWLAAVLCGARLPALAAACREIGPALFFSLLVVTVWLKSEKRNPSYALYPMLFMYFTTLFATCVTARNLYVTIASNPKMSGMPVAGAWAMIVLAVLLIVAALFIGWDGLKAYRKYGEAKTAQKPAPAGA